MIVDSGVTIIFEAHATTVDNENDRASGWADADLSGLGIKQCTDMGFRYKDDRFHAIFCSRLRRSFRTAEMAFGDAYPIIRDPRLNECNYGEYTRHPNHEVEAEKLRRIRDPFPGGESYDQVSERMKGFLQDLLRSYAGKRVMIIGHRATHYSLEHWINGLPLDQIVAAAWTWRPGWEYRLFSI